MQKKLHTIMPAAYKNVPHFFFLRDLHNSQKKHRAVLDSLKNIYNKKYLSFNRKRVRRGSQFQLSGSECLFRWLFQNKKRKQKIWTRGP